MLQVGHLALDVHRGLLDRVSLIDGLLPDIQLLKVRLNVHHLRIYVLIAIQRQSTVLSFRCQWPLLIIVLQIELLVGLLLALKCR